MKKKKERKKEIFSLLKEKMNKTETFMFFFSLSLIKVSGNVRVDSALE